MSLNLREKEDILKYALLLQQEETEILHRVDFFERVQVSCGTSGSKRIELDIYDGDIIFCTEKDRFSWGDGSGAYLCIDGCYKRLMYTPGVATSVVANPISNRTRTVTTAAIATMYSTPTTVSSR